MDGPSHIIDKQVFDLTIEHAQDGHAIQNEISELSQRVIRTELSKLFDRMVDAEVKITIDQLEIDIGEIQRDQLETELPLRLVAVMEEKLSGFFRDSGSVYEEVSLPESILHRFEVFLKNGHLLGWATGLDFNAWQEAVLESLEGEGNAKMRHAVERLWQMIRHHPQARERLIYQFSDRFIGELIQSSFLHFTLKLAHIWQQLAHALPSEVIPVNSSKTLRKHFWEACFQQISGLIDRPQASLGQILETILRLQATAALSYPTILSILQTSLTSSQHPPTHKPSTTLLQQAIADLIKTEKLPDSQSITSPPSFIDEQEVEVRSSIDSPPSESAPDDSSEQGHQPHSTHTTASSDITTSFETTASSDTTELPIKGPEQTPSLPPLSKEELEMAAPTPDPLQNDPAAKLLSETLNEKPASHEELEKQGQTKEKEKEGQIAKRTTPSSSEDASLASSDQKQVPTKSSKMVTSPTPFKVGDSFYVPYAGLVLIHPFLTTFFDELGLLADQQFKDEEANKWAVHLLQFLVSGKTDLPEYELLLPKFLCGLPFETPIKRDIVLPAHEKKEADHLLKAVIKHWGALGNSSPEALREGFLSRSGKLEKRPDGWRLLVEQHTLDILLNQLPWNLSFIKLPWLEEILHVEWN